jgi:hypothetical protein
MVAPVDLRTRTVAREALLCSATAALLASLLVWLGPPGADFAAHAYQRSTFLQHGYSLWNNFWYAGRYSFVTYSLIYYPLAALLGIKLLAAASVAASAFAFAVVIEREWGRTARWSGRTFAVVWAGFVLSGAFPFTLGFAFALLALAALQAARRWAFAGLAALSLAASPLAFLLLTVVLAGIGLARWRERRRFLAPTAAVAALLVTEAALWRLFPDSGRYPFSWQELLAVSVFCLGGLVLTWNVDGGSLLRSFFVVYLVGCLGVFAVPSAVGENVARLRFLALPVAVLALSLRRWRPLPVAVPMLLLALSWNVTPLAFSFVKSENDPAASRSYWEPAIRYLHRELGPSYRVESVDDAGHWDAVYLPRAGIPLARGWFRQNDFPQNRVLYDGDGLSRGAYLAWLRSLGVRFVVVPDARLDYSSRKEAKILRSGRSRLIPVLRTEHLTVYEVPAPRRIVTGPAPARVVLLTQTRLTIALGGPGTYRVAIRYSPYWSASSGCLDPGPDGMIRLRTAEAASVQLRFHVNARRALAAFTGRRPQTCDHG